MALVDVNEQKELRVRSLYNPLNILSPNQAIAVAERDGALEIAVELPGSDEKPWRVYRVSEGEITLLDEEIPVFSDRGCAMCGNPENKHTIECPT